MKVNVPSLAVPRATSLQSPPDSMDRGESISASGAHVDNIIWATQTVDVQSSDSPRAVLILPKMTVNKPRTRNHDGTDIGEVPLSPRVIRELTIRLRAKNAETIP